MEVDSTHNSIENANKKNVIVHTMQAYINIFSIARLNQVLNKEKPYKTKGHKLENF